jgi:hypothetical protein
VGDLGVASHLPSQKYKNIIGWSAPNPTTEMRVVFPTPTYKLKIFSKD